MASLFGTGIVNLCLALTSTGQYNDACNHAVDAGTRQVGWRQNVDEVEDKTNNYVTTKASNAAGKEVTWIVGAGAFIYKTEKAKSITFHLPTMGIASSITNEITPTSYNLSIKWNF